MNIFFPNASISYPPAVGPHIHHYQFVKTLTERGHHFATLQPDENPLSNVLPKSPLSVLKAVRWADVIYCRTNEGLNAATALTGPLRRWLIPRRCAVIWQLDLDIRLTVSMLRRRDERQIAADERILCQRARRVDAAIGVTQLITERARHILGVQHAYLIQNGSDPEMFRPDVPPVDGMQRRGSRVQVAWIGSAVNAIHDVELIHDLCRLIDQQNLPIDVHVIGQTEEHFAHPYPKCMVMHGPVAYPKLPAYLSGMDVGLAVYNIRYDGGSPLKLFDYLASGCVPICSPCQPMEEVLSGAEVGFIKSWTASTLADQLMQLRSDRAQLDRMSRNGRRLIEHTYSWQRIAERTEVIMQEAIERRAKRQ